MIKWMIFPIVAAALDSQPRTIYPTFCTDVLASKENMELIRTLQGDDYNQTCLLIFTCFKEFNEVNARIDADSRQDETEAIYERPLEFMKTASYQDFVALTENTYYCFN